MDLRVIIMGADPVGRAALAAQLAELGGLVVVHEVDGPGDLSSAIDAHAPDAVLWDRTGADESFETGPDLIDLPTPVVVLTEEGEPAAPLLAAGARGVLPRDADATTLTEALTAAAAGLVVLDPRLAGELAAEANEAPPEVPGLLEPLTPREIQVLGLLADGLSNRDIAERLRMSDHTAKFHVAAILGKLGARTRTEAVARAARLGLIVF